MNYRFYTKNIYLLEPLLFQAEIDLEDIKLSQGVITFSLKRVLWESPRTKKFLFMPLDVFSSVISEVRIYGASSFNIEGEANFSGDFSIERLDHDAKQFRIESVDQSIKFEIESISDFRIETFDKFIFEKTFIRSFARGRRFDYSKWKKKYLASSP